MTDTTYRTLALVGMPGSGKTLCAEHLQARGFFQFRFGSIITDEVERRGLPINPENERTVREEFRDADGMAAIAKRALPLLKNALTQQRCIVIDGVYSFSEYKLLSDNEDMQMIVVAITAPRALRYARLSQRPVRPLTPEEARLRDYQEIERLEKGGTIAIADYTLVNDTTPLALLQTLDALLEEVNITPE
ncbi:MAG: AAA family ATPase [Aggregatilineales bacterium]